MQRVGRNDPCPCGSGKKFKKCCEAKAAAKKFTAQKLDGLAGNVSHLTSLFKSRISDGALPIQEEKAPSTREEGPSTSKKS